MKTYLETLKSCLYLAQRSLTENCKDEPARLIIKDHVKLLSNAIERLEKWETDHRKITSREDDSYQEKMPNTNPLEFQELK